MILVRDVFHCRQGDADKFVAQFKAMAEQIKSQNAIKHSRVMTDLSGRFDTVVIENVVESIDDYFAMLRAMFADPEMQAAQGDGAAPTYESGQRTFYTIEGEYSLDD